jgi:hypothetical protein
MNKFLTSLHFAFVTIAIIYWIVGKEYTDVAMNFGISLAFDPFNQQQKFQDRPKWQIVYLISLLIASFTFLILGIWFPR